MPRTPSKPGPLALAVARILRRKKKSHIAPLLSTERKVSSTICICRNLRSAQGGRKPEPKQKKIVSLLQVPSEFFKIQIAFEVCTGEVMSLVSLCTVVLGELPRKCGISCVVRCPAEVSKSGPFHTTPVKLHPFHPDRVL